MGVLSNKILKEQLMIGDHIYTWRLGYVYAHHGIYVGDGKVIHFTQAAAGQGTGKENGLSGKIFSCSPSFPSGYHCPTCGDQSRLSGVISSCLDCFLYCGDLYRFEYGVNIATFLVEIRGGTSTRAFADSPEQVLHRAKFLLLENGFGAYDLVKNNCIDFAIYCKTSLVVDPEFWVRRSSTPDKLLFLASLIGTSKFISSKANKLLFLAIGSPCLIAASGGGLYVANKLFSDIGVRPDAIRIAVEDLVNDRR